MTDQAPRHNENCEFVCECVPPMPEGFNDRTAWDAIHWRFSDKGSALDDALISWQRENQERVQAAVAADVRDPIPHRGMVRVLRPNSLRDGWLVNIGDRTTLDIPGGRVTLELNGGWSESGIAYCRLSYEPLRSGLMRFSRA